MYLYIDLTLHAKKELTQARRNSKRAVGSWVSNLKEVDLTLYNTLSRELQDPNLDFFKVITLQQNEQWV